MNNEKLNEILNQIEHMSHLKSEDIPSLDLYMDQIMTLFDVNLADNKRHEDDKLLTKTMINNYSKEGLLKPIKGKKYSKNHILQMLLIYSLKNTISIQEIIENTLQKWASSTLGSLPVIGSFFQVNYTGGIGLLTSGIVLSIFTAPRANISPDAAAYTTGSSMTASAPPWAKPRTTPIASSGATTPSSG